MYHFNLLDKISLVLLIIGGLNWGLIGLLNFNLVTTIFSVFPESLSVVLSRLVYILVGLAAVNLIRLTITCIKGKN
ncbi:DUF378 domain-containing protein [Clostridium senegalense]|uniref:DUF378 domain-containing protein n=1 Tax=Clostridium senegalense TaxID=1465809 RepID=UPI000288E444|nr:DUF378 domain-containing protein [Clostridium senegalense]MBU5227737.1 DUF378 domain-containing protein [Clostridium senegalense]